MKALRILISGAGIAGMALAYWLHDAGHEVTIVEQAPQLRKGGYAVDFRGKAIDVLRCMGILEQVQSMQTNMGTAYFVDSYGKRLASLPPIFISGELEILRHDLAQILFALTKDKATYIFSDSIAAVTHAHGKVNVMFRQSKPAAYDIIVGADGTYSNVRQLVFGSHTRYIHHLGYGLAAFTMPNWLHLDRSGVYYAVPGKLAGVYSSSYTTEAKAYFYFAVPKHQQKPANPKLQKQFVTELFAQEGWQIPQMLTAMLVAEDFYFDTMDQVRIAQWHTDHAVLLGDAAYCASPLSGAGSGMAIIGAYLLARELSAADNLSVAFRSYQQAMQPYVNRAQRIPRLLGALMVPNSQFMIDLRIGLLQAIAYLKLEQYIAKLARLPSNSASL